MASILTRWDEERYQRPADFARVEALARSMAEMTGVHWDSLTNYPGFEKGRWRAMASELISKASRSN